MKAIYILPMGNVDTRVLGKVRGAVTETFGLPVRLLPEHPVPRSAYHPGRGQYYSTAILHTLLALVPEDALRLLAVTGADLFVPQLNYVFGEATVDGQVSIISLARLHPEFYGEPGNERLLVERAVKEAVHELGHTFGLRHCPNPECVMYFSNDIRDTDRKSARFCPASARLLLGRLAA
ncbi:MAG: archaemetzincin family Zn-dependent metalloprotease [Armatimonadota bacterium]